MLPKSKVNGITGTDTCTWNSSEIARNFSARVGQWGINIGEVLYWITVYLRLSRCLNGCCIQSKEQELFAADFWCKIYYCCMKKKKKGVIFATPFTSPAAGFYSVQVTLHCRLLPGEFLELWCSCSLSWLKGGKANRSLNQSRIWSVKVIPKE